MTDIQRGYEQSFGRNPSPLFHSLVLTDCSNALSAVNNISGRCEDKYTRVSLYYIRDAQRETALSFVCASFNLPDIGTNQPGKLSIYRRVAATGVFEVAFLTREECKMLLGKRKYFSISCRRE